MSRSVGIGAKALIALLVLCVLFLLVGVVLLATRDRSGFAELSKREAAWEALQATVVDEIKDVWPSADAIRIRSDQTPEKRDAWNLVHRSATRHWSVSVQDSQDGTGYYLDFALVYSRSWFNSRFDWVIIDGVLPHSEAMLELRNGLIDAGFDGGGR